MSTLEVSIDKIFTVTGSSSLFELINKTKSFILAKNLETQKVENISLRSAIVMLREISIYVKNGNEEIFNVFSEIHKKNEQKALDIPKDKSYEWVKSNLPKIDFTKFYDSNSKKLVRYYNILVETDFFTKLEQEKKESKKTEEQKVDAKADATTTKTKAKPIAKKKPATNSGAQGAKANMPKVASKNLRQKKG